MKNKFYIVSSTISFFTAFAFFLEIYRMNRIYWPFVLLQLASVTVMILAGLFLYKVGNNKVKTSWVSSLSALCVFLITVVQIAMIAIVASPALSWWLFRPDEGLSIAAVVVLMVIAYALTSVLLVALVTAFFKSEKVIVDTKT